MDLRQVKNPSIDFCTDSLGLSQGAPSAPFQSSPRIECLDSLGHVIIQHYAVMKVPSYISDNINDLVSWFCHNVRRNYEEMKSMMQLKDESCQMS